MCVRGAVTGVQSMWYTVLRHVSVSSHSGIHRIQRCFSVLSCTVLLLRYVYSVATNRAFASTSTVGRLVSYGARVFLKCSCSRQHSTFHSSSVLSCSEGHLLLLDLLDLSTVAQHVTETIV